MRWKTKIAPISNPLECLRELATPKFALAPQTFANWGWISWLSTLLNRRLKPLLPSANFLMELLLVVPERTWLTWVNAWLTLLPSLLQEELHLPPFVDKMMDNTVSKKFEFTQNSVKLKLHKFFRILWLEDMFRIEMCLKYGIWLTGINKFEMIILISGRK